MATVTPSVSEQRKAALLRSTEARTTCARFRESLAALPRRDATLELARVLVEDAERVGIMKVHRALELAPRFGPDRVRKVLQRYHIWPLRQVRSLTARQRGLLAGELVLWASPPSPPRPHPRPAATHCRHGHEYTPENITVERDGSRRCVTCRRATARRRMAAYRVRHAARMGKT